MPPDLPQPDPSDPATWTAGTRCTTGPDGEAWTVDVGPGRLTCPRLGAVLRADGTARMTFDDPNTAMPTTGPLVRALAAAAARNPGPGGVLVQLWQIGWAVEQCDLAVARLGGWCVCRNTACERSHDPDDDTLLQPALVNAAQALATILGSWADRHPGPAAEDYRDHLLHLVMAEPPRPWAGPV